MMPRISVIIPLYNREEYIGKCLESVLSTGYGDLEIVVVDDGSLDHGPAMVRKAIDSGRSNIRLLAHPSGGNKGVSASRNLGIAQCTGDYVTFLDSDDVMTPWRFAASPCILQKYPGVDAVMEPFDIFDKTGAVIEETLGMDGSVDDYARGNIRFDPPGIPWTGSLLFRKSVFSKSGVFDERKRIGEDFDLWYRVYAVGLIVPNGQSRSVCRYRRHAGNTVVEDPSWVHLDGFLELYRWARSMRCDVEKCRYLKRRYTSYFFDYFFKARSRGDRLRELKLLTHVFIHLPSLLGNERYLRCGLVFARDILTDCFKRKNYAL